MYHTEKVKHKIFKIESKNLNFITRLKEIYRLIKQGRQER